MPKAEFEEKSYEVPLVAQIMGTNRQIFSPGQVLEELVGFDVAMRCLSADYWRFIGKPTPSGVVMDSAWFPPLVRPRAAALPTFSLNLFIQVKRPERLTRSSAVEWDNWHEDYYRYDLVPHQQDALEDIVESAGANAHVAYAAPAFHTTAQLFAAIDSGRMVVESNFADAAKMAGHGRYSYTAPGIDGVGHSNPEPLKSTLWTEHMPTLVADAEKRLKDLKGQNVVTISGSAIEKTIKASHKGLPPPDIFESVVRRVVEAARPKDEHRETLRSFIMTNLFCLSLGTTWLIGGSVGRER